MTEYLIGNECDREEIVDFINYVFSHAHNPHDFKKLTPHVYGDDMEYMGAIHYIAKEDGKIKALVAMRVIDVVIGDSMLKYALIGNVAVHPYSRGKGYMKTLMNIASDEAKKMGVDIMALAGQRQRYGYFGFETGGYSLCYTVSDNNIRHCYGDVDCSDITLRQIGELQDTEVDRLLSLYEANPIHTIRKREEFVNQMSAWGRKCRIIYKSDELIGYVCGDFEEVVLKDDSCFPVALKAIFAADGKSCAVINVHPYQKSRIDLLSGISEYSRAEQTKLIKVLCWEKALKTLFRLQSQIRNLEDGKAMVAIEDEVFEIVVSNSIPAVQKCASKSDGVICLTNKDAVRVFFGLSSMFSCDKRYANWLPLPYDIDIPDSF